MGHLNTCAECVTVNHSLHITNSSVISVSVVGFVFTLDGKMIAKSTAAAEFIRIEKLLQRGCVVANVVCIKNRNIVAKSMGGGGLLKTPFCETYENLRYKGCRTRCCLIHLYYPGEPNPPSPSPCCNVANFSV